MVLDIDARIVAASNRDLSLMAAGGEFLPDLLDRLNVLRIQTPALREHREDIPDLIEHFNRVESQNGVFGQLLPDVQELLAAYDWPGNVRELFNVLHRVVSSGRTETPSVKDFQEAMGIPLSKGSKE